MFDISSTMLMFISKIIYTIILAALLFVDAIFLGLTQEQVVIALIGSLSGSFLVQRFKRQSAKWWPERIVNILSSAIAGIFIGAASIKYFNVESIQYIGATFFFESFVILILLKALFAVTESNAKGIVTNILRSFIKIDDQIVEKKTKIVTKGVDEVELIKVHEQVVVGNIKPEIKSEKDG